MTEQIRQHKREVILSRIGDGASIVEACQAADIARATFYTWRNDDEEFAGALQAAELAGVSRVEANLIAATEGGYVEETTTEKIVSQDGKELATKVVTRRKYIPANVTAQIFYLCNRDPERWKQRQEVDVKRSEPVQIIFEAEVEV